MGNAARGGHAFAKGTMGDSATSVLSSVQRTPVQQSRAVGEKKGLIPPPPVNDIKLGPVEFQGYGLILGGAGLAGAKLFHHNVARAGIAGGGKLPSFIPAIIAGAVGARLYHVASEPGHYRKHPGDIPKIWEGGLGIYGGIAGGTIAGAIIARRAGLPASKLLDAAAPALALSQGIGRWGNYSNQELYGKPTDKPWGMQVDSEYREPGKEKVNSYHPTFLYESAWNLGLAGGLYTLGKKNPRFAAGTLFAMYVGGYGAGRFVVDGLRSDKSKEWGGLRQNQWVSLGLMGAAGLGAVLLHKRAGRIPLPT